VVVGAAFVVVVGVVVVVVVVVVLTSAGQLATKHSFPLRSLSVKLKGGVAAAATTMAAVHVPSGVGIGSAP